MKPRNKTQQRMWERFQKKGLYHSSIIPPAVKKWALRTFFRPGAMASGRKAWCTECGESFPLDAPKGKGAHYVTCPHCAQRLLVTPTRKRSLYEVGYFQQLDTDGEFQIIRMYEYEYSAKAGRKSWKDMKHVYDLWLTEGFQRRWRFSVPMKMFYYKFQDPFGYGTLELRNDNCYYRDDPARGWYIRGVYPRRKVQPWLEKYDIRPPFLGLDIYETVLHLMSGTRNETVWKLRRWDKDLCEYYLKHGYNTERFYRQLCLAHKHGYKPSDPAMWFDHLQLLAGEKKDTLNPRYIFPADLSAEHQILIDRRERRRQEEERRRAELEKIREEKARLERDNADSKTNRRYRARYGQALAVVIKKGDIEISPLQNVQDFFEQGKELHQCVYGSQYYLRPEIICLCVRVAGVRTETVEVFLKERKIGQCRGNHNQNSPRHDEILALATKSMNKFINAVPAGRSRIKA